MTTVRVHLVVEGQTEEEFVKRVLAPHLGQFGIFADARCVMTSRKGAYWRRGGLLDYRRAETDLRLWMKSDQNADAWFSTMFDLYALPQDFPDFAQIGRGQTPYDRVNRLEGALASKLDHRRFVPYIQLHEFEALLFSDPEKLGTSFPGCQPAVANLVQLAQQSGNPEMINDGADTAPSKRIIREIPEYEGRKASAGPLVTEKIGLRVLREKCAHFAEWLERLEGLAGANA
jgi:hypothetical protein